MPGIFDEQKRTYLPESIPLEAIAGLVDVAPKPGNAPPNSNPEVHIKPVVLPVFDSYFKYSDMDGSPAAPSGASGNAAINTITMGWQLDAAALFRTYEVYEGTASGFTPDTTGFTNRILTSAQTVVSVTKAPGSGPWYYKVCAVNTRGERSAFVTLGPYTLGKVTTQDLVDDAVTAAKLAAGAVGVTELSAGAVTSAALAAGAVDLGASTVTGNLAAGRIAAGTLAAGVVYAGTVATDKLVAGSALIGTALVADAAITNAKIGALAVDAAKIADAAITTAKIGDAQITNAKITALDAAKITAGTLAAGVVYAGDIAADQITAGTITGRHIRSAASGSRVEITDAAGFTVDVVNTLTTVQGIKLFADDGSWEGLPGLIASVAYDSDADQSADMPLLLLQGSELVNVSGDDALSYRNIPRITGLPQRVNSSRTVLREPAWYFEVPTWRNSTDGYLPNVFTMGSRYDTKNPYLQFASPIIVGSITNDDFHFRAFNYTTYTDLNASAFNVSSLRAFKRDIADVGTALSTVLGLRPRTFKYGSRKDTRHGFVVEELPDELLAPSGEAYDVAGLLAIVVKAVQELSSVVSEKKAVPLPVTAPARPDITPTKI